MVVFLLRDVLGLGQIQQLWNPGNTLVPGVLT